MVGLWAGEVRLSCTQHDLLVPVSHHAIFYGEPKLHSMCKYCGKYWSLVISHLILTDTFFIEKSNWYRLSFCVPVHWCIKAFSWRTKIGRLVCNFAGIAGILGFLLQTKSKAQVLYVWYHFSGQTDSCAHDQIWFECFPSLFVQNEFASLNWMKFFLLSDA